MKQLYKQSLDAMISVAIFCNEIKNKLRRGCKSLRNTICFFNMFAVTSMHVSHDLVSSSCDASLKNSSEGSLENYF